MCSQVVKIIEISSPYVTKFWAKCQLFWEIAKVYEEWFPAVFGLFLVRQPLQKILNRVILTTCETNRFSLVVGFCRPSPR